MLLLELLDPGLRLTEFGDDTLVLLGVVSFTATSAACSGGNRRGARGHHAVRAGLRRSPRPRKLVRSKIGERLGGTKRKALVSVSLLGVDPIIRGTPVSGEVANENATCESRDLGSPGGTGHRSATPRVALVAAYRRRIGPRRLHGHPSPAPASRTTSRSRTCAMTAQISGIGAIRRPHGLLGVVSLECCVNIRNHWRRGPVHLHETAQSIRALVRESHPRAAKRNVRR